MDEIRGFKEVDEKEIVSKDETYGKIGFILNLIGLLGCCLYLGILSIPGLILTIIQLKKSSNSLSIASLIIGIVAFFIFAIEVLFVAYIFLNPEVIDNLLSTTNSDSTLI